MESCHFLLQLFKDPSKTKQRALFGMPLHSITAHYALWFRLIPLSSMNTENQERFFKEIKSACTTTNFQNDHHLLTNAVLRERVCSYRLQCEFSKMKVNIKLYVKCKCFELLKLKPPDDL